MLTDFSDTDPNTEYRSALKEWRESRVNKQYDVLSDMWEWDRELMVRSDTPKQYERLRQWPLVESIRWLVTDLIDPSD